MRGVQRSCVCVSAVQALSLSAPTHPTPPTPPHAVLRIDQIIMAKMAGGPKPRGGGGDDGDGARVARQRAVCVHAVINGALHVVQQLIRRWVGGV